MSDAPDLSPREAVDRWLDHARIDRADETIRGYWSRLKMFVEWCESDGVESTAELTPWDIERYETNRRGNDLAPTTLRNELVLLRMVFEWFEKKGLATDGLADSIELPNVSKTDETSNTLLEPERAQQLLQAYRSGETEFIRGHAFLELAWFTGLRMGAIRGLDLADVDLDEGVIHVNHRPESNTPLKNGLDGERVVGISKPVVDALQRYMAQQRPTTRQSNGRRPLFATEQGRISPTALRTTSYYATLPCRAMQCPHGRQQQSCEWFSTKRATNCPSSRSPHEIRSGSITWQLNSGVDPDVVAHRVNASRDIIEHHYDQAEEIDKWRQRQSSEEDKLGFDSDNEDDTQ